jgi:hypothetical protein
MLLLLATLSLLAISSCTEEAVATVAALDDYEDFIVELADHVIFHLLPQTFGYFRNFTLTAPLNAIIVGNAFIIDAHYIHLENITFVVDRSDEEHKDESVIKSHERTDCVIIRNCAFVGPFIDYVTPPAISVNVSSMGVFTGNRFWGTENNEFAHYPPDILAELLNGPYYSNVSHSKSFTDIIDVLLESHGRKRSETPVHLRVVGDLKENDRRTSFV